MIKFLSQQFKDFLKVHKGLIRRYKEPFVIIDNISYKIQLPSHIKIHLIFHLSMLKPYHEDVEDTVRSDSSREPLLMKMSFNREVDKMLADKVIQHRGVPPITQYLVRGKQVKLREKWTKTCGSLKKNSKL